MAPVPGSSFLQTLKKGSVKEQEEAYHQQFKNNLLGNRRFRELVDDSMREAGLDNTLVKVGGKDRKLTAVMLGTPEILAQLPPSSRQKFQKSLDQYLGALAKESGTNSAFTSILGDIPSPGSETDPEKVKSATAAAKTWQKALPEITQLKEEQQRFNATLTSHLQELAQDMSRFATETGLPLPAEITAAYQGGDPIKGKQLMQAWLSQQRVAFAQNPQKLQDLEGLEHFALQLDLGAGIQNRVACGQQIDDALIQQYERFQTFVQTKQALMAAYAQAGPERRPAIREALFNLGRQFAASEQKPIAAFRRELASYLDRSVGAPASTAIPARLAQQQEQLEHYNQMVRTANEQGVTLVHPENQPPRIETSQLTQDLGARLTRLAQNSSHHYRQTFLKGGDKALAQTLAREQEKVLKPLALKTANLHQLFKDFQAKTETAVKTLKKPSAATARSGPKLPDEIRRRLAAARTPEQFAGEVKRLQDDLRKCLASYKAETRRLVLAQLMKDWLENHIREHYQERHSEADHTQQRLLQHMTEQTQDLIEQALLSSANAEQPLEQVDSAFSALLSQSQQSTPPVLSQSDSSHLLQVLKTEL